MDGLAADGEGPLDDQGEQGDHREDAEEAEFLGDDREQKVGMGLRQIEQFLDAGAKTDTEQFAAAEGDQRMRQLIATAEGVGPRVHEAEDAVAAVGRDDDQRGKGEQQAENEQGEQARLEAAEEENAHGDRDDDDEGAEIGLLEQQHADHRHRAEHRQEGLPEVVHDVDLAHGVVGGVEHCEQFHQFGRLQVDKAERQPAAGAIHVLADTGNQDDGQQDHANHEQQRRITLPQAERHLEGHRGGAEADSQKNCVARQVVGRLEAGGAPRLGNRDRCRIDHHHAGEQQQQHAPQQRVVDFGQLPARRLEGVEHHAGNPFTAAMKASARCA